MSTSAGRKKAKTSMAVVAKRTDLSNGVLRARVVVSVALKKEINRVAMKRNVYPNQVIAALLGTHAGSVLADFDAATE